LLIAQLNRLVDPGDEWDPQHGAAFLRDSSSALFLAFSGEQAVGFLTANRLQRFDARGAEVLLYEIGVREDFRRRGIARALVQEAKLWAREVGADVLWVLTNRSNAAAVALYKATGGKTETADPDEIMYDFDLE
jgi:GNAT superfamily N-acetyltransferase